MCIYMCGCVHEYHSNRTLNNTTLIYKICGKPDTGKFHSSYIGMNVCGSAYKNGCVVDGKCGMAAD